MNIRKHFRTSSSTINYIISDFDLNRITDKNMYFKFCVNNRLDKLNESYDNKLDRMMTFIIKHYSYDNLPIIGVSKIIMSLSKITNALTKGLISLIT